MHGMYWKRSMVRTTSTEVMPLTMWRTIAASMLYRVLFTADTAAIFTDGYIGITEATSLLFGDVLADWRKNGLNALPLP